MGCILEYIENHNEGNFNCYSTKKFSLDDHNQETLVPENSDTDTIPLDTKGEFAEDDERKVGTVRVSDTLIKNTKPYFHYFLDGSRHVFKVDDIAIGTKIFPIVAGQIVVGCCKRPDRCTFKKEDVTSQIVISLPKSFHTKGKPDDFARYYCQELNAHLMENNRFTHNSGIGVNSIVFYPIDGVKVADANDKNRFVNSAIAQIQNKMTDEEQLMVNRMCTRGCLDEEHWLIKDGSIQYNKSYSKLSETEFQNMRSNYQYVVGVSKSFNPELLQNHKRKKMSQIIAGLRPFERTKAYKYRSEMSTGMTFAIWYLRIRNSNYRETNFSDIVKCEMIMFDPAEPIRTDLINAISANLIREAYPVCYGRDSRWGNHLYPVYLTESFCKSQYISNDIFLNLF